ncbi:MAG TPA: hypothetical protein VFE50_14110, partial [Cyclobacteriaceae bacterium]|nr:hypothetical protein [Cyclobacteriaceae bacterium]
DSGYVTDTISGAQAYFPYTPEYEEKFENNISYRSWTLKKYAMEFTLQSFEAGDQNLTKLAKSLTEYVKNDRVTIRSVSTDTSKNTLKSFFILDDSSGYTYYTKWIYSRKNLYCINSRYPISSNETTGYAENALSFLNSFSIADTSDH